MTDPSADTADVAEYEALMASRGQHRGLRAAVVILKVIAALYLVAAVFGAFTEYGKLTTTYQNPVLARATNPYIPTPTEPSFISVLIPLLRDAFVAFFIFVGGDVIKLQLNTRDALQRVSAKLGL